MSQTNSPRAGCLYGLKRVCHAWDVSRSTYYSRQKKPTEAEGSERKKPGPKPGISDSELLDLVKQDIAMYRHQFSEHKFALNIFSLEQVVPFASSTRALGGSLATSTLRCWAIMLPPQLVVVLPSFQGALVA